MREVIRQKLVDGIPEIGGRVYDPHQVTAQSVKPFILLRQAKEENGPPWSGFNRIYEIWPYTEKTSFQQVDTLADKIIALLHEQMLKSGMNEMFTCRYLGCPEGDKVENGIDGLDANGKGMQFSIMAIHPGTVSETEENDPWLEAVAVWTETVMGTPWQVYRNFWPLDYVKPSILWRLVDMEVREKGRSGFEIRKEMVCHVLGRTTNEQIAGMFRVVQELGRSTKLALDNADKRYLRITMPSQAVDAKADPLTVGQITIIGSRLTTRPQEEAPLMTAVHFHDGNSTS